MVHQINIPRGSVGPPSDLRWLLRLATLVGHYKINDIVFARCYDFPVSSTSGPFISARWHFPALSVTTLYLSIYCNAFAA